MKCKIDRWFEKTKWLKSAFELEVHDGHSLRQLSAFLRGQGLSVSEKTIAKHLKLCMRIKKKERLGTIAKGKLRDFFVRPEESKPQVCKHTATELFYDVFSEKVHSRCSTCKIILGNQDPEGKKSKRKSEAIRRSLNRR